MEPDHNAAAVDPDKDTVAEDLEDIAAEDSLVLDIPDRTLVAAEDNLPADIPAVDILVVDILEVDILPLEDTLSKTTTSEI